MDIEEKRAKANLGRCPECGSDRTSPPARPEDRTDPRAAVCDDCEHAWIATEDEEDGE